MRERAMLLATAGGLACLAMPQAAWAGDKPLVQPVPAWVKPAPPIDPTKISDDSPALIVLDNQQRLSDGQVWSYVDTATRAANPQIMAQMATLQFPWQPAMGDLIIHKAEIIRGAEHIDLLKNGGANLTVLRREQQLEQLELDGMLTATLPVEGLRVGDVLHVAVSTTRKDPTLQGNMEAQAPLLFNPFKVQFARLRMLWPSNAGVQWHAYAKNATASESDADGFHEVSYILPLPKQPEVPEDAPARYRKIPVAEASTFASWERLAAVMAPLYVTTGQIAPGGALAQEVAKIRAASADPMVRAAMALQLVQDKVRYLMMGMNTGNYVPQKPETTWSVRYGDCKAKSLLLLSILHELGIEAEAVLANSKYGDMLPDRVPSAGAFDHVFVRATINGQTLWLDGTRSGTRLGDLADTPDLGHVLPLRAAGASLIAIQQKPDAMPGAEVLLELDHRAGTRMPGAVHAVITFRGEVAAAIRGGAAEVTPDQKRELAEKVVTPFTGDLLVDTVKISSNEAQGVTVMDVTGISSSGWRRTNGTPYRLDLDKVVPLIRFAPDRSKVDWRDIPVKNRDTGTIKLTYRIRLPQGGQGFTIESGTPLHAMIAGHQVDRVVTQQGEWVTVESTGASAAVEIAAADIPQAKRQLSQAQEHPPRIVAPADAPQFWTQVAVARKAKLIEPMLAIYTRRIAEKPEEEDGYSMRATFEQSTFDRQGALADVTRMIAINPSADNYIWRSRLYRDLGDNAKALADAKAAYAADSSSKDAVKQLAAIQSLMGDQASALTLLDERIGSNAGDDDQDLVEAKAEVQGDGGDKDAAAATLDAAIVRKPGNPDLLNSRCWLKGTLNFALETALRDCTRSIELSDAPEAAMDSRAMVYFRMERMDDALADLNAALDRAPTKAPSLFMRGVILKRTGHVTEGNADLIAARTISPQIDSVYRRWGIVP